MKTNDGQFDDANHEIETLRKGIVVLQGVCARRFDLLKRVAECQADCFGFGYWVTRIPVDLQKDIANETDEHEVNP